MIVRDAMTAHPECIDVRGRIRDALRKMMELNIRHLPVLDNGELVGIISDRDIKGYLLHLDEVLDFPDKAKARLDAQVTEVMQSDVVTLEPEDSLAQAIDIMLEEQVGAVPVVEPRNEKLIGILSYVDILKCVREYVDEEPIVANA
ncbi:MAG: hypothetical protein DCC75_12495 [Proteobacteria bacterium]|nr:MAG: hypothetical protein DCC75_12495 [Pseudomonadota bacterium]